MVLTGLYQNEIWRVMAALDKVVKAEMNHHQSCDPLAKSKMMMMFISLLPTGQNWT
jgi:hypothetical protein